LEQYKEIWVVDFEFIAQAGERQIPVCLSALELRSGRQILLWQDQFGSEPPYDVSSDSLFVAYYASAELGCHRTLGWKQPERILDLYVEFRNYTNGLPTYNGKGLLGALAYFGLNSIDVAEKTEMRDLVLRGGPWTVEEKGAILAYCQTDTNALARLLPKMLSHIDLPRALYRGRYMSAVSAMEFTGVPIDTELLGRLVANWEVVQERLIREVDAQYGVYDGRSFRQDRFETFLAQNGMGWPRLDSGRLALDDDTFEEMANIYPALINLRKLRQALSELRLNNLQVGADGFNRALLSPFSSITGRNQPSNSKYIFGPGSWLRSLIRPKQEWGVAYVDWSQQEFGIAAALSDDPAMKEAYASGDPYLTFAKQAKAVPTDATKDSHGEKRELFKRCVLGVQYGMEGDSLARRIQQPEFVARDLLRMHREVYKVFWRWSDNSVDHTILTGRQWTVFGWTNHVKADYNARSIRNFFMQANGAEMLRLACCLGTENGIQVCAPVHDAVMLMAPLERIEEDVTHMQELMRQASEIVLDGFSLGTDAAIVRHPDRYSDKRGKDFWNKVMSLL
jgi:DNA polymerase-1